MQDQQPVKQTLLMRQRLLLRGESVVASAGIALAGLLLAAMAASSWWIHTTQRASSESVQARQTQTAGNLLAQAAEMLLAQNDLSGTRTLLADTAHAYHFSECQLVLPDGQVLAAAEAAKITARQFPAAWPAGQASDQPARASAGVVRLACAMKVPGRGALTLQIAAPLSDAILSNWQTQSGVGAIGAAALFLLLLIYRRMRSRLRALGAIREALLMAPGGAGTGLLALASELGPEAKAWNQVVADIETLRKQNLAEKVKASLERRHEPTPELESACDALSHGLLLIDQQQRIRYANGAAAVFLRARREDLIGADVARFIAVDSVLSAIREVSTGTARRRSVQDIERQQDGAGGGVLRFGVRPVRRDDSASAMLTIEDITQQKVAEQSRHSFVAQATHELRTPLTNMRLYLESAIEDGESDPATRAKCLNVINAEARRLERIVGEMLSVAEIEAGTFKLVKGDVRLDALLSELQADFQQQAAEKNIELTFNLPPKLPVLNGDRDKIMLALHNLVGNALKYTNEGGKVTVNVDLAKGQLTVEVKDTGIGMAPDDQARVFQRFYRAHDPRVAKITGTGLGLALAREVARLHGGDIILESELDRGSTFTLSMPAPAEAA